MSSAIYLSIAGGVYSIH